MTLLDAKIGVLLEQFTTTRCSLWKSIMFLPIVCKHQLLIFLLHPKNCNLFLPIADNLTEALMFLSHFIGDVHQVISFLKSSFCLHCNMLLHLHSDVLSNVTDRALI